MGSRCSVVLCCVVCPCAVADLLPHLVEKFSFRVLCHIVSDLEVAVRTDTFGVDDTLGDALAVEMSDLVNQRDVLQEDRTVHSNKREADNDAVSGGGDGRGDRGRDGSQCAADPTVSEF